MATRMPPGPRTEDVKSDGAAKGWRIVPVKLNQGSPLASVLRDHDVVAIEVADEWTGYGTSPLSVVVNLHAYRRASFEGTVRIQRGGDTREVAINAPRLAVGALVKALGAVPLSKREGVVGFIATDTYPKARIRLGCVKDEGAPKKWTFSTSSQARDRAPWEVRVAKHVYWANGPEAGRALRKFRQALGVAASPEALISALDRLTAAFLEPVPRIPK